HFIVCGTGHTGQVIMEELAKTHHAVVVIEKESALHQKLMEQGILAIHGDAMDDNILQQAGISQAKGLFTTLSSDRDNAFVALTARGMNPKIRIVSSQIESNVREKLLRSGVSAVVNPRFIGGMRMASEMLRPAVVGFLDHMLHEDGEIIRFEEVTVPENSPFLNRPIGKIKGAEGNAALVVSVRHAGGNYELNPTAERSLKAGETLVVLGTSLQLSDLRKKITGN
ncbi:MAG: NAD-binding protein, partial [Elusimicrobia bacterium]|nr:NAD-binding protein [Elusimicrobiota bacterium]